MVSVPGFGMETCEMFGWLKRLGLMGLLMTASARRRRARSGEHPVHGFESGRVVIQMRFDLAPEHVARIKELAEGFYDGIVFHRVIEGFMAKPATRPAPAWAAPPELPAEFSPEPYVRGTIGMARTQDPNSGDSQFFICFQDCSFLGSQYTVWGQVTEGMELVDGITGEPPANPDAIKRLQVAADALTAGRL